VLPTQLGVQLVVKRTVVFISMLDLKLVLQAQRFVVIRCGCLIDLCVLMQAYTSQILAIVMFALMMSEDRVSMQPRRKSIIDSLKILPGNFILCMRGPVNV
jgi:glucosamine 6-phosphate synthetase-like amidotransferase/phosphosugar isomerase protein